MTRSPISLCVIRIRRRPAWQWFTIRQARRLVAFIAWLFNDFGYESYDLMP